MAASSSSGFLPTVRAELAALDVSVPALRRFGWMVGGVALALAAFVAWRNAWTLTPVATIASSAGGLLVLFGTVAPRWLRPTYLIWMGLAFVLGFVMTRVILSLAFVLVFTPVGLFFRLIRRDVLHQQPDPDAETYWIARDTGPSGKERLERMY
ncbi:MAG: SxtJ family membrane protein [Bacteroidota bacterium]